MYIYKKIDLHQFRGQFSWPIYLIIKLNCCGDIPCLCLLFFIPQIINFPSWPPGMQWVFAKSVSCSGSAVKAQARPQTRCPRICAQPLVVPGRGDNCNRSFSECWREKGFLSCSGTYLWASHCTAMLGSQVYHHFPALGPWPRQDRSRRVPNKGLKC